MKKAKKGYILIEVIVVITIALIIGSGTLAIVIDSTKDYLEGMELCYVLDDFDNAMLNVDVIINSNGIIDVENNIAIEDVEANNIVVKYKENITSEEVKTKIIYFQDNKLMVKTITEKNGIINKGNNVLLKDVLEFKVWNKENLIYYHIKTNKGGDRIRCI